MRQSLQGGVVDAAIPLHHGKDFFTKQDGRLVTVDSQNRMKIAIAIEQAICHKAVNVGMPDQKVAESLSYTITPDRK